MISIDTELNSFDRRRATLASAIRAVERRTLASEVKSERVSSQTTSVSSYARKPIFYVKFVESSHLEALRLSVAFRGDEYCNHEECENARGWLMVDKNGNKSTTTTFSTTRMACTSNRRL
ncbi:uncharacterized protein LOC122531485 [Frieseomelitta varia]|uniref:uncharacterized protein LOC122531485 n=1 Tax=Frieseomelitta varia TaxID=561572 RepID=UPI001CB6A70C|nr:uncharacterized protein LOC122531485 [Frieseomelitta varia]